jgi:hypothetical protein
MATYQTGAYQVKPSAVGRSSRQLKNLSVTGKQTNQAPKCTWGGVIPRDLTPRFEKRGLAA